MSIQGEVVKTIKKAAPNIAWGLVVDVGPPVQVRMARDSTDVTITLWLSSYTPTTNDKVLLVRAGQQWVIVGDMVSS